MNLEGLIIDTANNFNSIPGLQLWLDSRFRKTIVSSEVQGWQDISNNGYLFNSANVANRMAVDGNFINFASGSLQISNLNKPFDFIHKNGKYGIYTIQGYDVTGNYGLITNYSSTEGTQMHRIASSGYINSRFYSSGSIAYNYDTASIPATSTIYSFGSYRNAASGTGNLKTYRNNSLISTLNASYTDADNSDRSAVVLGGTASNKHLVGLIVIYDWSAFTDVQIDAFNASVLSVLEKTRLELGAWPV